MTEERNKGSLQFLIGAMLFRFGERLMEGGPADNSLLDDIVQGLGAYAKPIIAKGGKAAETFNLTWDAVPKPVSEDDADQDIRHQARRYAQLGALVQLFHDAGILARQDLEAFEDKE